jgi:hypothetical protein
MLLSVRIRSSTRSMVMMFWYPRPATSRSPGLLEVPAASSVVGCWAPSSQDTLSRCLWSKQLAMGGQTLTCVICRSGISGLDLFFTTSSGFGLLGLGGCWVGSVVSSSGAGSSGAGSSGAGGSGAGVAVVGFGLYLMSVTDLMKQNQLYYYTRRKEQDMHYSRKIYTYSEDFFMTAFFILKARGISTSILVAGGGVTPADCAVPTTAR